MITYREADPGDFAFLYALHKAAMREYVEDTFGPWEEDYQLAYYRRVFNPPEMRIIRYDGEDVGLLHVQPRAEELFVASLEILPAYQRRGIGSAVMREVMADAARQGKPVALQVLRANIRARDLYQRLGFGVTGENDTHYILAFMPSEK